MTQILHRVGWIGGPRFDLFFFFGSGLVAALLGVLALGSPRLVIPLWWLWLLLLDGPHLLATYTRSYLEPDDRARFRRVLLLSPLILLPGPLLLGLSLVTSSRLPFDGFLLVAALWSFHHSVRQHYGILAIYERHAQSSQSARRLDKLLLHGVLWAQFALFLFIHPENRAVLELPRELTAAGHTFARAAAAILGAVVLAYSGLAVARVRRGSDPRPVIFLLLPVLALQAFGFFFIGAFEPLVPGPRNPEEAFLAIAVVGGTAHGLQYLGIVFAANRRRMSRDLPTARSPLLVMGAARCYGLLVLCSLLYLALVAARGIAPGLSIDPEQPLAKLMLALYWGIFFHHYILDQYIWRPSQDAGLRAELGLAEAS